MSVTDTDNSQGEESVPYVPTVRVELRALGIIAAPLVAAYLAEMVMFNTPRIVVGQLGYRELPSPTAASSRYPN